MGERVELSQEDIKNIAKYMSGEINSNIDAHVAESLEAHSIRIDLKWEQKVDKYNKEVYAAIYQQQQSIDCVHQEVKQVWKEIDILKKNKPIYYFPKKIIRISFWTTFVSSLIAIIYLLWRQFDQ